MRAFLLFKTMLLQLLKFELLLELQKDDQVDSSLPLVISVNVQFHLDEYLD